MAIYAYLRLSTDELKQTHSFNVQEQAINDYAKTHDLAPIESYFKDTMSGAELTKRTALMELLGLIKKGDKVIIQKLDRLSRDTLQTGWIRTEIVRRGAELVIVETTADSNDPLGVLMEQIITAFAQYERQMIKSRIQSTLDLKKAKGEKLGGSVPFGYSVVLEQGIKKLVPCEKEQRVIASIKRYHVKGLSLRAIADKLKSKGVTTKTGREFKAMQIKRVIDSL